MWKNSPQGMLFESIVHLSHKINTKPRHEGLEHDVFFFKRVMFNFYVLSEQGVEMPEIVYV